MKSPSPRNNFDQRLKHEEWDGDELPVVQDSCTIKTDKQILSRLPCCLRREGIPWLKHSEFPKAVAGLAVKPVLYPFTGSITGVVTYV